MTLICAVALLYVPSGFLKTDVAVIVTGPPTCLAVISPVDELISAIDGLDELHVTAF